MAVSTQGAEQRLAAIEVLLLWEGRVSNTRLREFFPIHPSQASRDLAEYRDRAPDNVAASFHQKEYAATPFAKAVLTSGRFDEYAALIGAPAPRALNSGVPTEVELAAVSLPSPHVFRTLHAAIAAQQGVDVRYTSLSHPEPHQRVIFPHALVFASPRWHLRAWCALREDFRDFNLGRIRAAVPVCEDTPRRAVDDRGWNQTVRIQLIPHEALTPPQRLLVRHEYMGGTAALALTRRVALVPYLLQTYRATLDPKHETPPAFLLQVVKPELLPAAAKWHTARSKAGRTAR